MPAHTTPLRNSLQPQPKLKVAAKLVSMDYVRNMRPREVQRSYSKKAMSARKSARPFAVGSRASLSSSSVKFPPQSVYGGAK